MKSIKSILLSLLGQQAYLRVTSRMFFIYFNNGWLRKKPIYQTHYFVKHLINQGDTIIDIGANLGYYARQFAALTGPKGKVYAVEPIELYRKVLVTNVGHLPQVEILPYALGETEAIIKMGNPSTDKHRHGLMRVLSEKEKQDESSSSTYDVQMKQPVALFYKIKKIDYIKCDIEGYEVPVIPAMKPLLQKHQPIVQIETDGENLKVIHALLLELHYKLFYVQAGKLVPFPNVALPLYGDLIGIPTSVLKARGLEQWITGK